MSSNMDTEERKKINYYNGVRMFNRNQNKNAVIIFFKLIVLLCVARFI